MIILFLWKPTGLHRTDALIFPCTCLAVLRCCSYVGPSLHISDTSHRRSFRSRGKFNFGYGKIRAYIYSTNTHTFSSSLKFLRDNMHACIFQDSASSLTLCPANNGISKDTVHVTLRAYVDVFLCTANDSYSKSLTNKTVVSFLGALRGLVSQP